MKSLSKKKLCSVDCMTNAVMFELDDETNKVNIINKI